MKQKQLYEKYKKGKHWKNHPKIYAKEFAEFLKDNNFQGFLVDLGCGNGRDVNIFQKEGFNVLGIDISEEVIKKASETFPNCKFEVQDIEKLNFNDNSVGAYLMINVIHYVNMEKALKEILRTLDDKGFLFIHFNLSITDDKGNIDYEQNEDEIMNLISNFEILDKKIFERIDEKPKKHIHKILQLILRK